MDEYIARMREQLGGRWAQEEGVQAQRQLRTFLLFMMSRVLFATKSSRISLHFLSLLEDLETVGDYTWGAAVLADLFYNLSTHSGETGISGFSPLLLVNILNLTPSFSTFFQIHNIYSCTKSSLNLFAFCFTGLGILSSSSAYPSLTEG